MKRVVLSKDYKFPSGKYRDHGLIRCYGWDMFEQFCKEHSKREISIEDMENDFLHNYVMMGREEYVIEADCAQDNMVHKISYDTTMVFRS